MSKLSLKTRVINRIAVIKNERRMVEDVITVTDNAIEIEGDHANEGKKKIDIPWESIQEINIYKRDLITTDLVCAGVITEYGQYELNEEMQGWKELFDLMPNYINITNKYDEIMGLVVRPAFKANVTRYYHKDIMK